MTRVTLTFFLEKELRTKLKIIAAKNDTTVSEILREFIEKYVNENE